MIINPLVPRIAVGLGVAAAVVAIPFIANAYVVGVALTVLMWIALTQSWCILSRLTGYVSLGHVVFYGLGAYLVVVTWQVWPLWLAVPAAGLRSWDCPCCESRGRTSSS